MAFLAWPTPLYANVPNGATIAFLGIFNGLVMMGLWQIGKYLPNVSNLVTGKARLTMSPPKPAEPPKDDEKPKDEEKPKEDEDAADEPEVTEDEEEEEKPADEEEKPEED